MNGVPSSEELSEFQSVIALRLGLRFDDSRLTFLAEALTRRLEARRLDARAYLAALRAQPEPSEELSALARELTVGETYFFRHADQFAAFAEVALPERLSARASSRVLRFLSAGCASGEEAYSIAITLRERAVEPAYQVSVQGFDLNPDSLAKARRALYSPWSLRETPDATRERWFSREGRDFQLAHPVRDSVSFEQRNLTADFTELAPPGSLDVVFCRNVLMYFTTEHASAVVARLSRALAPGGFLFLGHAETLRGLSHDFHLRHTHNTFYYQRRDELDKQLEPSAFAEEESRSARVVSAGGLEHPWIAPWLETVERSSHRIRELSARRSSSPELPPDTMPSTAIARDLSQPLELLRSERYTDALALLEPETAGAPDAAALLLRAALLTHQGDLPAAERVCHALLRFDDLNAGAHYLLALCCERRGQAASAVEHDLTAVYLDAGFAMPHLHLGLMARRRRDAEVARRELTLALSLLEGEDASRLLLFAGGFSRAALLGVCRSELGHLRGGGA